MPEGPGRVESPLYNTPNLMVGRVLIETPIHIVYIYILHIINQWAKSSWWSAFEHMTKQNYVVLRIIISHAILHKRIWLKPIYYYHSPLLCLLHCLAKISSYLENDDYCQNCYHFNYERAMLKHFHNGLFGVLRLLKTVCRVYISEISSIRYPFYPHKTDVFSVRYQAFISANTQVFYTKMGEI